MYKFSLIIICKVYFFHSTTGQILPTSPCPDTFHYEWIGQSPQPNEMPIKGVIIVTSSLPIYLKIKLHIPAILTAEYQGRLQVADIVPVSDVNLITVKYNIYYPKNLPLPLMVLIEVNSIILCSTNPVRRPVKTTVVWEHALRQNSVDQPGDYNQLSGNLDNFNVQNRIHHIKNQSQVTHKTCGKSIKPIPFKVDGTPAKRGEWPWLVPLFKKTELGMQFICSSTLIDQHFVLTAAHCLKGNENVIMDKADLIAYVGKFNIKNWIEDNTQPREVSEVHVHPDYNADTLYSDLALLKLKQKVHISRFVNPVCIWAEEEDLNFIVDKKGIVSGWGTDNMGHKIADGPSIAVMPIVSQEECLRSKMEFMFLTSSRTFCAGFRDGTGPCNGDSGGGLFLLRKDRNGDIRWFLRGVVSLSLVQDGLHTTRCNLNEYTIFTDIAKFRNWLLGFVTS